MDNPAESATADQRLRSLHQTGSERNGEDPVSVLSLHQNENNPVIERVRGLDQTRSENSSDEPMSDPSGDQMEPRKVETNSTFFSRYDKGWRRIVTNFSPSWFSVTMGTGIVSTILITIPWKAQWLYYLSIIFFVLNVALFSSAFFISVLRYTLWPEIWTVMVRVIC